MEVQDHQAQVRSFMRTTGQETPTYPKMPSSQVIKLRASLINEEFKEFIRAIPDHPEREDSTDKLAEISDSIADLLYVVYGTAIAFGIDIHPIFNEVHRSNMTKLDGAKRVDGKILKGPNYDPPKLNNIISYQIVNGLLNHSQLEMTLRANVEIETEASAPTLYHTHTYTHSQA